MKEDYPNGNLIYREDYQRSFKAKTRFQDTKDFLKKYLGSLICLRILRENLGEVYDSYNNGEKERAVCRPSRVDDVHNGFDKRKQSVKMADIYGIEKVWRGIYGSCCEHGDFMTLRSIINIHAL